MISTPNPDTNISNVAMSPRRIRSSGKATGSVEITLPPEFYVFSGADCELIGSSGSTPSLTIVPNLKALKQQLQVLFDAMTTGFGCLDLRFPNEQIVFSFCDTIWHQGKLNIGLRDCGFLNGAISRDTMSAGTLRLLVNFCRFVIDQIPQRVAVPHEAFVANAVIKIVYDDNASLGLFERDTIDVATSVCATVLEPFDGDLISKDRWLDAQPLIFSILAYVQNIGDELSTIDSQRKDWARALRITSKVA